MAKGVQRQNHRPAIKTSSQFNLAAANINWQNNVG